MRHIVAINNVLEGFSKYIESSNLNRIGNTPYFLRVE